MDQPPPVKAKATGLLNQARQYVLCVRILRLRGVGKKINHRKTSECKMLIVFYAF